MSMIEHQDRQRRASEAITLMETLKSGIRAAGCRSAEDALQVIEGVIMEARTVVGNRAPNDIAWWQL